MIIARDNLRSAAFLHLSGAFVARRAMFFFHAWNYGLLSQLVRFYSATEVIYCYY